MMKNLQHIDKQQIYMSGDKSISLCLRVSVFIKIMISCFLLVTCCIQAKSQSDSLYHYIEIGIKNNPVVLQKFYEYQASMQKIKQVGSLPDPELSMGIFLTPMELIGGKQVADIRLMQMFPWFGVLHNAKSEMELMAKAKYELFSAAKLELIYNMQQSYYELYNNKEKIRITQKNVELLRTIERLALVKFQTAGRGSSGASVSAYTPSSNVAPAAGSAGMNTMGASAGASVKSSSSMSGGGMAKQSGGSDLADLYQIQMEIAETENELALYNDQNVSLLTRFNAYMNRPLGNAVFLPDTLVNDSIELSYKVLTDSLLSNSPMLKMSDYEIQSLDARKQMVRRMGYPMVGLGFNYSLINKSDMSTSSMNGSDMIMPMITVTIPLYRGKYNAMQKEAELQKSASQQNYQATANSLQTEYSEAWQFYYDAQRRLKLYYNQNQLVNNILDLNLKSYSSGSGSLSDILRIRQQSFDYELKYNQAVTDYNTAIAWIKKIIH
jgi:outer membrane protein TolC